MNFEKPFHKDGHLYAWVRIEIKKNSVVKYEWSEHHGVLVADRILHGSQHYFFNYGEIPQTEAGDGDCIDVIVLTEPELANGSFILCKIIGMLNTTDEKGEDAKIIAVPESRVDPDAAFKSDISDVSPSTLRRIEDFYATYKSHEKEKWVRIDGFEDRVGAADHVMKAVAAFESSH